jgi:hypothetical protein
MKRLVLILLLGAALLAQAAEPLRLQDSIDAMGTTYIVVAYAEDEETLDRACRRPSPRWGGWTRCCPTTGPKASGAA